MFDHFFTRAVVISLLPWCQYGVCSVNRAIRLQVIPPRLPYSPPFSSHLEHFKCNLSRSISHKAKQARFKSSIPRSVSHDPKQARFNRGYGRAEIRNFSSSVEIFSTLEGKFRENCKNSLEKDLPFCIGTQK